MDKNQDVIITQGENGRAAGRDYIENQNIIIKPNSTYMVYTGLNKISWVWFLIFFPSILYFKNNLYAVIFLSLLMVIAILLIQLLTIYHIFIYDKDNDYIGTSKGDRIEFKGIEFQEKGNKVTITSVSTPIELIFFFKKDKENFVNFLNKKKAASSSK